MKKELLGVCVIFILLFSLANSVSADIIEEKINSIVNYAESYEMGKINYLQLIVYGNTIREEINSQLGQEYVVEGDWVHHGLSQDDVKKLFGQPTEMTSWVWVINEEHDERLDEELPKWEKRLFDGRKIMITFNAWPQIIKKENEIIKFYEVDFNIRFKTHYEFNLDDMLKEIKYKAEQYVENKQNGEDLVEKTVEYGEFLRGYLDQNNDDCKNTMEGFFDVENKREQQKKARFSVIAFEGDNLLLRINAEACESCDWPHVNVWFDIDFFGPGFKHEDMKEKPDKDLKSLEELSIDELNAELEDTIRGLVSLVKASDNAGKFTNPERIGYSRAVMDMINRFLDEKYYENKRFREENYEKRLAFLTDLLSEYGEVEKEALTEIRYENRLVEEVETISHKRCRHVGEFSCGLEEGCKEGECVDAKGGLEECHNGIDDDGDGIIDCPDPDCAVECGWICKDLCQDECWSCNERECSSDCKECWGCDGKDCEDLCKDTCWKCQKEKCESQAFCENCQRCQKDAWHEYEGEKCNRICDADENSEECENCQTNLKYQECRGACGETCWKCRSENCHETDICQKCWDCEKEGGKDCKGFCNDCHECENENCNDKEICSECKECENEISEEIEKERCDKRCNRCDDCKEKKGEKGCKEIEECRQCDNCRAEEKRHLCDDVCEDECWPCHNEECGNQCGECWGCDFEKDGKKCENMCEDCWDCTWDECGSQEFCESCKECEKRIWLEEHPCALPCDICKDCTERGDEEEEYCIKGCKECFDCETPDDVKKCVRVCNIIINEDDETQREKCHDMCREEVIFYCHGVAQTTPCLNMYYMCPGRSLKIPCDYFICTYSDGTVVKQTAPCGQESECGMRRKWIDKQCICDRGWYDCDADPLNGCESNEVCEGAKEMCSDMLDNDFDGLIDCQDLSDCENKRCDPSSQNVCKQGECVINCPENFILNENEECVPEELCMVGYEYDKNGKCVKIGKEPEINDSINVTTNATVNITTNITEKVNISINVSEGENTTNITSGTNGKTNYTNKTLDCSQCGDICLPMEDIMVAECLEPTKELECVEKDGECVAKPIEPIINDTEVELEAEPPINDTKINDTEVELEAEPPINDTEVEPEEEIECPDGYYFKDDKCLFIEDEGEVCGQWQILTDKGVCEDIVEEEEEEATEEEEIEIIETGKLCTIREDCEDENAICSMGMCKLIPEEVIEEEEPILVETVETEEVPETEEEEVAEEEVESEEGEEVIEEEQEIKEIEAEVTEEEIEEEMLEEETVEEEEIEVIEEEQEIEEIEAEVTEEEVPEIEEEVEETLEEEFIPIGNVILEYFKDSDYLKTEKTTIDAVTGWVVKERECEEDKDCGENTGCDSYEGRCHCEEYFFDCNGNGNGGDADGCEAQDPTCGGRWDACKHECMPNQVCVKELGRCECEEGFQDCDGDWENGCEAQGKCEECETNDDCAQSRCTEWDNSVVKFACVDENPYVEEKAVIAFSGGCNIKATGKTESYLNFDFWGEEIDELNELRHEFESKSGSGWCKREVEGLKKQRKELENALDQEFLKWFFEEYVADSPAEWEKHISGIFASYWRFVDNARQLHEMSFCLEDSDLDIDLIDIEYESEYGEIHYWEEIKQLEGTEIITPFMQIWVFPTKEFIKEEFKTAMQEGRMPGPENEDKGPSPKEIEETKKNEEVIKKINKLSDKYGGSADFLIQVQDEDETLFKALMIINPEDIVQIEIINEDNQYNEEPDVNVIISFDFLYNTIKTFEEEAHLESPPWAKKPARPIKKLISVGKLITKISAAVISGDIKVSPITAVPTILNSLKLIAGGSM